MLEIKDLSVYAGNINILRNINLNVKDNKILAIIGLNGSGKTTLAKTIVGFPELTIKTGYIKFNNKIINDLEIYERSKLGITILFQNPAKFKGIKVESYLKVNTENINLIKRTLYKVGLDSSFLIKDISKLSGGERKRVELASILLFKPKLVIIDELDSGIDLASIPKMKEIVRDLSKNSIVLLITHNKDLIDIADEYLLMCHGEIRKQGKKEVIDFFTKECEKHKRFIEEQ